MVHVDSTHIPNDGQDRQHIPPNLSIFWATVRSAHISDQRLYEVGRSCSVDGGTIGDLRLERFKKYVEVKEVELWQVFQELDVDGSGPLGALKLSLALNNAGTKSHISQFIAILAASRRSDFEGFLFLPRRSSLADIYQLCNVRRRIAFGDGPATTPVEASRNEDKTLDLNAAVQRYLLQHQAQHGSEKNSAEEFSEDEENEPHTVLVQNSSLQFLLAGGFAGVVSRTCTAPFDRLKVFLITRPPHLGGCTVPAKPSLVNVAVFKNAVARIYAEGGVLAFWTGNGLSVAKVFPESAIKFFTYESAKRAFAKYWDDVDDPCEISGTSRFLSGGIGGISSQLSIYPVETLKTQMMTSMGHKRSIVAAIHHVWSLGGVRAYYRGLMIGLIGVFPYSAIDMSTFEALKLAYMKSTGKEQAGVLALLAFGSISGSIGAISVYPLNLVRTRLQASGSAGHPQRYSGVLDVAVKTWERDGWRGFYRGLFPTLAKVIPSVSITYTVYEYSKRRLGV